MKLRGTTYTFDASAQTVDCALFTSLEAIQLIVNVTDQVIIYNFADSAKGGTLASTTLTLEYDTTSMDDTDKLMILVDDGSSTTAISASSLPLPTGASTSAKQDTIIGHVDGIETLITSTNTKLDTLAGYVDGIETLIGTTNTSLSTIDGRVDGLEGLLTTLAGAVSGSEIQADILTVPADPFGTNADAAATAGSTGSIQAKLRLITSQLDAIKTSVETLDNTVGGSELQVDVLTMPTTTVQATNLDIRDLSSVSDSVSAAQSGTWNIGTVTTLTGITNALPSGTNAIGKLAANSGVDIGDVDVTSLPALAAGTNAIGKFIPPDYDVTSHTAKAVKYYTSAGAATDGIIWSPAAGKRWHVTTLFINVSAAATVTLEDDLSGGDSVVMKMELAANSGVAIPFGDLYPLTSAEDAADLLITTSAGNVYVTAVGYEI